VVSLPPHCSFPVLTEFSLPCARAPTWRFLPPGVVVEWWVVGLGISPFRCSFAPSILAATNGYLTTRAERECGREVGSNGESRCEPLYGFLKSDALPHTCGSFDAPPRNGPVARCGFANPCANSVHVLSTVVRYMRVDNMLTILPDAMYCKRSGVSAVIFLMRAPQPMLLMRC
jgi:hypothetical protein